ncbi:MAG: hypothetical protein H8K04_05635 [Nitrospira sp.]
MTRSQANYLRKDAVALIQQRINLARPADVLVNNRSEDDTPLTIQVLMKALLPPTAC